MIGDTSPTDAWFTVHMGPMDGDLDSFGYTDGLLEVLGHELLVWTRPTDGTDPGLDLRGGRRSVQIACQRILEVAAAGALELDSPIEVQLPNGVEVLTVKEPVAAHLAGADSLAPNTPVSKVSWELRRNDFGLLTPPSASQVSSLVDKCREVVDAFPLGFEPPPWLRVDPDDLDADSFSTSDEFGPATPLVRAVAASISAAHESVIEDFLANVAMLKRANDSQLIFERRLSAVARGTGRSSALSRCDELAASLHVSGPADAAPSSVDEAVRVTLKTAALHDVLEDSERLRGYGPWESSLYFPYSPPAHVASAEMIELLRDSLSAAPGTSLAALVERREHVGAFEDLEAFRITHRAGLPRGHTLLDWLADMSGQLADDVHPVLATLLSCLVWRHQEGETVDDLSAEVGWMLVNAYGDLLPSLALLLRLGAEPDRGDRQ